MNLAECRALLGHTEWAESVVWQSVLSLPQQDARAAREARTTSTWCSGPTCTSGAASRSSLASSRASPRGEALRDWAREYYGELPSYLATLSEADLVREVRFPWADRLIQRYGKAQPAPWTDSLTQIAMHSGYHRGQVARRLRELGQEPPLTDFIAWIWMGRPAADWGEDEAA